MAYSIDFRKAAIKYLETHSEEELYEAYRIHSSNVYRWKNLLEKNGSLEPQYPKTRKRKIDLEELKRALERKPDLTLPELAKIFNCRKQSVDAALKKGKITRKKKHFRTLKDNG